MRGEDFNFLDIYTAERLYETLTFYYKCFLIFEYKTQERIHRHVADWRLLAIPAS